MSEVVIRVVPEADTDAEELAEWAGQLHREFVGTDFLAVTLLAGRAVPEGAKGSGSVVGHLVAQVGTLDSLRAAVDAVRAWVSRTGRTVEVSIGGDVVKVTRATEEQQERIINAWLARHAPDA